MNGPSEVAPLASEACIRRCFREFTGDCGGLSRKELEIALLALLGRQPLELELLEFSPPADGRGTLLSHIRLCSSLNEPFCPSM